MVMFNQEIFFFDIKMSTDDKLDVVTEVTFPSRKETIKGKDKYFTIDGGIKVEGHKYKKILIKGQSTTLTSFEKEYLKAHLSNLLDLE